MLKRSLLLTLIMVGMSLAGNTNLTLAETLRLADANNKNIKIARAEVRRADALYYEALSTALPTINLDLNYNRNFLDTFFYISMTDSTGRSQTTKFNVTFRNQYQMNAVLNQTLYSFGKVGSALDVANYYEDFTDLNYNYQREAILTTVKKSFYQVLLLEKVWQVARDSQQNAKANYENIKIRYESGAASEYDLLQAEVRWQNSIPDASQARKNYELAINNLKSQINIPIDQTISLSGSLEQFPPLPDSLAISEVFDTRKDFNALLLEKKMRDKAVDIEFANHLPSLNGSLIYSYSAQSNQFKLDNQNDNLILGISLHVPIFSGGYTNAQVQKAKVDADNTATQIALNRDNITIQVKNVRLRLREAHERISATSKNINSATRAFEIAESRTQNGLSTQLELKDSRVLLDRAKVTYYSAIYDYLNAYFDWQQISGRVNTNTI